MSCRICLPGPITIALILIIGTGVIDSQLSYIQNRDLGYTRDQVVTIKDTRWLGDGAWTFAAQARKLAGVSGVTVSGNRPDQKVTFRGFLTDRSGRVTSTALLEDWTIDADYLPTLGMKLTAGRNFSPQFPTDSGCILINGTAARVLGYAHPLGSSLYTFGSEALRIIGVVKDFNTGSLRDPVDPVVFRLARNGNAVTLRLSTQDIPGTLKALRSRYEALANGHPFVYSFLDDDFSKLYIADERTGRLFTVFSLLAILIAAKGMFGLVAAAAEQRTKEIGVRRVLGARMIHLVWLLVKDYGLAIGLALLIVGAKTWQTSRVPLAQTLRQEGGLGIRGFS
ncbi:FtsX-like permease family protein [Puia sp.]|uniref:FtsX-like permease family protein n=1 Tax=Puia sp. TaxID=2045100 RepID=UPI002F403F79